MKERRYDIDWLRVIAMLTVFIYHCTRFFGTEGWHLKNAVRSEVVFILTRGLIWPWVMELFFVLSGVGAWFALKSRSGGQFLWDRAKRLLIPLYTVGVFILLPPQLFVEAVYYGNYSGTYWEWLWRYYGRLLDGFFTIFPFIRNDPTRLVPINFSGHLWFLQYLFLISLVTLPILLYLKSEGGQRLIDKLAGWVDRRGGIFLFIIPLALILVGTRSFFSGARSWTDILWYGVFFLFGYIMVADKRFTESIKRHGWAGLVLWLVFFFGVLAALMLVLGYDPMPGSEPFSLYFVIYQIAYSIGSWGAVVFMLSLGAKYMNFNNKVLVYANEAVLPFYLLHQTVILCVGYFVIRRPMGMLPKFLIIAVVSFVVIMAIYELLIRRFNIVRFFFGMRPKKKPIEAPTPHSEGTAV